MSGAKQNTAWNPRVEDLKLPNVPAKNQVEVRNILRPALGNIPVEEGECWRSAQQLTLAGDKKIKCVEGAYIRHPQNQYRESINDHIASEHAWNTVSGHIVDLTVELFVSHNPLDNLWMYEQLKEYSYDDVRQYQLKFKADLTETDFGREHIVYHSMTRVIADEELEVIFSGVIKSLQDRRARQR